MASICHQTVSDLTISELYRLSRILSFLTVILYTSIASDHCLISKCFVCLIRAILDNNLIHRELRSAVCSIHQKFTGRSVQRNIIVVETTSVFVSTHLISYICKTKYRAACSLHGLPAVAIVHLPDVSN